LSCDDSTRVWSISCFSRSARCSSLRRKGQCGG
jgi:hypothetical protein